MKASFFPKLAADGIKKNRQIYFPYLLTCVFMVMMFYIMCSLGFSPTTSAVKGGSYVSECLVLATFVIGVFALLFLLYSNSFLNKRRYKEFGLYHVLGMGKRGLRRIVFWESLFTSVIGLVGGLFAGIVCSKFSELLLANILQSKIDFSLHIDPEAILVTLILFGVIFLILMVKSLIKVQLTRSLELFKTESLGEKPPKTRWIITLIGLAILVTAYVMAGSIKAPLKALFTFFFAAGLVVIATYLLFIAGSVALCRILKSNKKYYYQKSHFVSVSSMVFRMKRNGAGLASICVLCTMVLIMLSSSSCMYFGLQDVASSGFCRDTEVVIHQRDPAMMRSGGEESVLRLYDRHFEREGVTPKDILYYTFASASVVIDGTEVFDENDFGTRGLDVEWNRIDRMVNMILLPLEDYNRILGTDLTLADHEAFVYTVNMEYRNPEISAWGQTWNVKQTLKEMIPLSMQQTSVFPVMVLVVPDISVYDGEMTVENFEWIPLDCRWYYGYNLAEGKEKNVEVYHKIQDLMHEEENYEAGKYTYLKSNKYEEIDELLGLFGGVFFIGLVLSVLFITAMVLIIYYKQISEGFEDQKRFEIMQKVGMTTTDIKNSIRSQILTVFFAPLVMAGVHVAFAFPMIRKILELLYIRNLTLVILISLAVFFLFGLFYAGVYLLTAKVYYRIVSGRQ
ncbi:MAG: ABC transporter permease [Lachnospiraceae bacterium]|nr:ABC transporter permease [Lachnospiraceae bacterium]